ncbi:MAG: hypothetical protein WCS87_14700 [Methylococcaceae bacterium]
MLAIVCAVPETLFSLTLEKSYSSLQDCCAIVDWADSRVDKHKKSRTGKSGAA